MPFQQAQRGIKLKEERHPTQMYFKYTSLVWIYSVVESGRTQYAILSL